MNVPARAVDTAARFRCAVRERGVWMRIARAYERRIVAYDAERDRLLAIVAEIAGLDCVRYDRVLQPLPCGECLPCRARAAMGGDHGWS